MSEADEQKVVVEWLRAIRAVYHHSANEGRRSYRTAAHLRAMGMRSGFPDLLIFDHTEQAPFGAAIEMKSAAGRVAPGQKAWLELLRVIGWQTTVARSADEAIAWLKTLGYGSR